MILLLGTAGCTGPLLSLLPEELPQGVQGQNYSVTLQTDVAQDTWRLVEGTLPPGMTLNAATGTLAGRPTTPGFYDFTLAASSRGLPARSGTRAYTLVVIPRLEVALVLPIARVGVPYEALPTIVGGVPGYTVQVVGLPAGLDFDRTTGRIFGTPVNGDIGRRIEVQVGDAGTPAQSTTASATLVVKPPGVVIVTAALPAATVGQAYSTFLAASDGRPPYQWRISGGVLPDGLRLELATGEIRGTPTTAAVSSTIEVTVTDADNPASTATTELTLSIAP